MKHEIEQLIAKMTLDQKIGATLTLGFAGTLPRKHIYEYITKYHCGGLRLSPIFRKFGNYVDPITHEIIVDVETEDAIKDVAPAYLNADEYKQVLDGLQKVAKARPLGIPLHFSYDQEGGTSADFNFGGVELFPKPMGLRASNHPQFAYEAAKAAAKQGKAVGFNYMHSPVLDVNVEPKNPEIYTRAFSDNAQVVTDYARELCRGLKEEKMIATGKHFPGRGASAVDAHYALPIIDVDEQTLWERELLPYKQLIEEDLLPSIMIAHSIYPALDNKDVATVSKKIVTGLLREKMGYKGVITTDSMTMGALATKYGVANACAMALEAGCDLVLMKAENKLVDTTFNTIKGFIDQGRITEDELDKKVFRILSMKEAYGMFDQMTDQAPSQVISEVIKSGIGSTIAMKSILPFKGEIQLPINPMGRILIVEQRNKNVPSNYYWHDGQFYHTVLERGILCDYHEIDYVISKEDEEKLLYKCNEYDTIIMTNFYVRSRTANNETVIKLQEAFDGDLIIIDNTPYPLSAPKGIKNRLTTLATTPRNLTAVYEILFENACPEGVYPLETYVEV